MHTKAYTLSDIAVVNLLGFTKNEIKAVFLSLNSVIATGIKMVVLFFDCGFMVKMHNLSECEQKAVIEEITKEYDFHVKGA